MTLKISKSTNLRMVSASSRHFHSRCRPKGTIRFPKYEGGSQFMQTDLWESGNPYEYFMGRWSLPVARKFIEWLSVPENQRWLDVGCGTGALSSSILKLANPQEVLAIDASDAFIAHAQHTHRNTRLTFEVADARQLPDETDHFDVAVSGIALNFSYSPSE